MQAALEFTPSQLAEIARACDRAEASRNSAAAGDVADSLQHRVLCAADIHPGRQAAAMPADTVLAAMIDAVLPEEARSVPMVWLCGVLPAGLDAEAVATMIREHCARQGVPGAEGLFGGPTVGNGAAPAAMVLAISIANVTQQDGDPEPCRQVVSPVPQRVSADRCASSAGKTRNQPPGRINGKHVVEAPYASGRLSAALFDLVNGTGVQRNG